MLKNLSQYLILPLLLLWLGIAQAVTINLSLDRKNLIEGDAFKLKVTLSSTVSGDVFVDIDGPGSGGTIGDDLESSTTFPAKSLIIPAGTTEIVVSITTKKDNQDENTESFAFAITSVFSSPSPVDRGQTIASGTIADSSKDPLTEISTNPSQVEIAKTVGNICDDSNNSGDLKDRCTELVDNSNINSSQVSNALQQIAPEEYGTQGRLALNTPAAQFKNLDARLNYLRTGKTGISMSGLRLNLNVNGQHLPTQLLASLFTGTSAMTKEAGYERDWNETKSIEIVRQQALTANLLNLQNNATDTNSEIANTGFSRLGFFVNGEINFGNHDTTGRESGFDFSTQGLTTGVDYRFTDQLVAGVAFGYTKSDSDITGGGKIDNDGYSINFYGTFYKNDNFYIDALYNFGRNNYDNERRIIYTVASTSVNQIATSSNRSHQHAVGLGAGYQFNKNAMTFTPNVRIDYTRTKINSFVEKMSNPNAAGAGWALAIDSQKIQSLTLTFGVQAEYAISRSWGVLIPHANLDLVYEFKDDPHFITGRFVQDVSGETLTWTSDSIDQDYFNLGLGVMTQFTEGKSAFFRYEGTLGLKDIERHAIMAGIRLEF
jgi:outer membrane autotransporter protein